jgi:type IV secretion system protein TrbE
MVYRQQFIQHYAKGHLFAMSDSVGRFNEIIPWNFITKFHEGVVIQKDGIMQRTFAYRAPDIDSSSSFEVNNLAIRVNDFAMRLGKNWAFQFEAQRFQLAEYPNSSFDTLAPYLIDKEREDSFSTAGRHFDSSYYLTFIWRPPSENVKKLAEIFIKSDEPSGGSASVKQNVEFFVNESNAVASLLANDLILEPLNNDETIAFLHSNISTKRHPIRFPHTQILLDRILPDCALENTLPMKLGDHYIPIVGINDFPDESYPAILDALNRAGLEYRWGTRYICLSKEEGVKEARKKEKSHRGSRKTFFQTFAEQTSGEPTQAVNHGASVKESDSITAGVEIETDQAALGYLTTCVMVWDTDLATAKKKADLIKTIINSKGFTCKDEEVNGLEAFQSMMAGQIYANYRALPVMTYTMSHIVPLSSVWAGLRSNEHAYAITGVDTPTVICSTIEGTPFFLNLNIGDVGHSAILGPTGAGKSTLLNLLEMQFYKYPGSLVIVFDKGRSCRQACLASGGRFFEPAAENIAGINFQPLRDLKTDRDMMDAMDFIESCITVNKENVSPLMRASIKESLEKMRDISHNRRTITTFLQYANYLDPTTNRPVIKDLLGDYSIGGKYGRIFDAETSGLSLDTRFLAIEMEALMSRGENCVVPALVYLFNYVEKKFDGRYTLLVLDEAWLFLKNETFSAKITEWLKVLRKKNVYVIFATQDVADVANSPLKTTIIQQCLTKIYLADPSAGTDLMRTVYGGFGLTESEISLIASAAMKRDYFYTSPIGRRLFQLDLGRLTLALIGSPDHALLDELAAKYEPGGALCAEILAAKHVNYKRYIGEYAPIDPAPVLRQSKILNYSAPAQIEVQTEAVPEKTPTVDLTDKNSGFLDAVASLPDRKGNDGQGRAAETVAKNFGVSVSTVYQARTVLKHGMPELVDALRRREIPVKTAYKKMLKERGREPRQEQASG